MRVVSMVPSWTEMLVEAGVDVVGRTRFCIHPKESIVKIPVVGGTKDLDWDKLKALNADLLLLDQEENLIWMKEQSPIPVHVTHVTSVERVAEEIDKLSQTLSSLPLRDLKKRWQQVSEKKHAWNWEKIPGEMELIQRNSRHYERLVYVIWKKPWMTVSRDTFIGSMLSHLGAAPYLPNFEKKYPEFQLEDFNLETTYFLFSSEPFPFHRKVKELRQLGLQGSVVDGESYSWFGLRSLQFLESMR